MFILKDIIRLPEIELIEPDNDNLKIEFKAADGVIAIVAHKEESKNIWLREIKQYLSDAVALQEHSIDDIRIDPKQHLDTNEPLIKLPQRIEAYENDQNIKPSDVAENYTISKFSTKKVSEEVTKTQTVNESTTTTQIKKTEKTEESSQQIAQHKSSVPTKEPSKIPVFKKQPTEEKPEVIEVVKKTGKPVISPQPPKEDTQLETAKKNQQVEAKTQVKVEETKKVEAIKKVETVKVEEKVTEVKKPEVKPEQVIKVEEPKKVEEIKKPEPKVEEFRKQEAKVEEQPKKVVEAPNPSIEKPKALPELKTEIVRKSPVDLTPVASLEKPLVVETKKLDTEKKEELKQDPVKSELTEVEQSVSEKLDKLSQKLRSIRKSEVDKELNKFVPKEPQEPTETEKSEENIRRQEAIKEEIQEKIDEDYIVESSVIRRIEERYKKNYKERYTAKGSKKSIDLEDPPKVSKKVEEKQPEEKLAEEKAEKPKPAPLNLSKDEKLGEEKLPKVTKAADSGDSKDKQSPPKETQQGNNNNNSENNQSDQNQDQPPTPPGRSNNQRRKGSGDKERSPPSPGSIKLPGFFDPPPPTQYEASIEVHVKKEKYPDPPPKITRKVVVKNEELEKKTEEFLKGNLPYEKEDCSLISAQQKIKNLKHNLGKTTDTIKFAEDTVSKAILGDFSHIKTPGTVVGERKKEPVFEYQYTVEDPKTGVCITTSENIDFEDAEEELIKLAKMDADSKTKITKRVEGKVLLFSFSAYLHSSYIILVLKKIQLFYFIFSSFINSSDYLYEMNFGIKILYYSF